MNRRIWHVLRALRHADWGLASSEYVALLVLLVALPVAAFNFFGNTLSCKLAGALDSLSEALSVSSASASKIEQCAGEASELAAGGGADQSDGTGASAGEATNREPGDRVPADRGGKGKGTGSKPLPTPDQWAKNMKAILCPDDKAYLQQLQRDGVTISLHDDISFADVEYDGKTWRRAPFPAAGATNGHKHIYIARTNDSVEDAATLIHEGRHTQQPASMKQDDVEPDAFLFEEQWRAKHGYPPHDPSFRLSGGAASVQDMRDYVDKTYPGKDPGSPAGAPEYVFERNANGTVSVERANGSVYKRKPRKGDSVPGPQVNKPKKGYPVDLAKLQCP